MILYIYSIHSVARKEGLELEIIISQSGGPIYQQIIDQTRRLILQGSLQQGDPLPSMRQLARDLRISLITTKRAYEELESMGLLVTVAGKGCFVGNASPQRLAQEHWRLMEESLAAAAAEARQGGVSPEDFVQRAAALYGGHEEE